MTHANQGAERVETLAALDQAFVRLRRLVAKPPTGELPQQDGCTVDLAKVLACEAIADLSDRGPATITDVAAYLDLERSTASRLLSEAAAAGLLNRETNPRDRRSTVVQLTDQGAQLVEATRPVRLDFLAYATATWNHQDLQRLADLIARFADNVDKARDSFTAVHHSSLPRD